MVGCQERGHHRRGCNNQPEIICLSGWKRNYRSPLAFARRRIPSKGRIVTSSKDSRKKHISTMHDKINNKRVTSPVDMEIQARLGGKLRISYQGFVNEPIPDRFIKLLNELEKWER
jgi:Anti-sigma factor NepR